jgi:L-ribulose-5-phosphate 3-epimerase
MNVHNVQICGGAYTGVYKNGGYIMRIGIRAHDVAYAPLDELIPNIHKQGFHCMHIALTKSIKEFKPGVETMTPGLAMYIKELCAENKVDVAVLGCYLNLCNPNPEKHKEIVEKYKAHIRFASILGCGVVGTETGAVNEEYKYEPANHSDEALQCFIDNLRPIVKYAEQFGVIVAIEPVWKHIVNTVERARKVLDAIDSPNLQIIFDPVNLLYVGNIDKQDEIIEKAFDLLLKDIAVVHCKDYVVEGDELKSIAAGTGGLNYPLLLKKIKEYKPYVHCTLENTVPENAVATREFMEKLYAEV